MLGTQRPVGMQAGIDDPGMLQTLPRREPFCRIHLPRKRRVKEAETRSVVCACGFEAKTVCRHSVTTSHSPDPNKHRRHQCRLYGCMYYVCMYAYIHTYIHVYTYTYTNTYTNTRHQPTVMQGPDTNSVLCS